MFTISASLETATRARSRRPAISLVHKQLRNGVPQLDWTQWYDGSEGDAPHASCVTAAGTLIRVRNVAGTINVSRVASPTSGSTYSSWTALTGAGVSGAGVAIAAGQTRILIAYVKTGGLRITMRSSTDDGVTWSSAADLIAANESATVSWCAVATEDNSEDDWMVVWNRGNTDMRMTTSSNGGSSWGAASTYALSALLSSFSGIALTGHGDYHVVVTGFRATSGDPVVAAALMSWNVLVAGFGNLQTWYPVAEADVSSGISRFRQPSIQCFENTAMITYTELETGNVSYSRSYLAVGEPGRVTLGYYTEPSPLDAGTAFGACLATYVGLEGWFLTTSDGVWQAPYSSTQTQLSTFLTSLKARVTPDSAKLVATFTSGDDIVTSANEWPMEIPGLAVGSRLDLQAGYTVSGVAEYGTTWTFEISRASWKVAKGRWQLELEGVGLWERGRYTRSRQVVYQAGASASRAAYFRRALARAGGVYVQSASSPHAPSADWTTDHSPDFIATPGQSWGSIAAAMLEEEAEGVYLDGTNAYVCAISTSDAADEDYSNSDSAKHSILELTLEESPPPANWLRVASESRYTDAYLMSSINRHGPRMDHTFVADSDDNTKAAEYVNAAISRQRWRQRRGSLTSPWHPGIQLYDVVSVADSRIGLSATTFRVTAIGLDYSRSPGLPTRHDQTLELSAL